MTTKITKIAKGAKQAVWGSFRIESDVISFVLFVLFVVNSLALLLRGTLWPKVS